MTVIEALRSSKQSAKALSLATGLTERAIRDEVQQLRRDGYAVCSGDNGYWLASSYDEVKACAARLISHGLAEVDIGRKMLDRALKLHGQTELAL